MTERMKMPVTVHLLFFREGRILLLRRHNTGYADGQYSVPAGHLEGNETVIAAAIREAREEVGVEIDPKDVSFSSVMHRHEGDERVDFFMNIHGWKGEPVNAEPDKCDDLRWEHPEALPENMVAYVKRAIDHHLRDIPFDEFGW